MGVYLHTDFRRIRCVQESIRMLGLFDKKSSHPMADPKAALALLEDLPKNDPFKALQEITAWVESLNSDDAIRLDNRFAVMRLLDDTARSHEIKVVRDYFSSDMQSAMHEKRLWKGLAEYYAALAQGYHAILDGCREGAKGASTLKSHRPLLAARGLNALAGQLKCIAAHYAPVEQEIWEKLGEYYADAEEEDYLDEPVSLYSGSSLGQSVRHQFAGVVMWWGAGVGSLKPLQIHLTERLASHLCRDFTVTDEPGEDTLYTFDLDQARAPARYNSESQIEPGQRFVGYGTVQALMGPLAEKLAKNTVPGEVNLGGTFSPEVVDDIVKRLTSSWLSAPPARRTARRNLQVNISIVRGFAGLIDVATRPDDQDPKGAVWIAEDVSTTGFRCVLDGSRSARLKVGSLVGFRPENVKHWGAAIVRRLRHDGDKLDVGIEIFTNRIVDVVLREDSTVSDAPESSAIWLGQAGAGTGEVRVLLRPGSFDEEQSLRMRQAGKNYLLVPQGQAEKGEDYDLMRYRVSRRDA